MNCYEFEQAVRADVNAVFSDFSDGTCWINAGFGAVLSCQDGIAYIHRHVPGTRILPNGTPESFLHDVVHKPATRENIGWAVETILSHLRG